MLDQYASELLFFVLGNLSGFGIAYWKIKKGMEQKAKSLGEDEEFAEMMEDTVGDLMDNLGDMGEGEDQKDSQ